MKLFELKSTVFWDWKRKDTEEAIAVFEVDPAPTEDDPDPEPVPYSIYFEQMPIATAFRYVNEKDIIKQLQSQNIEYSWNIEFRAKIGAGSEVRLLGNTRSEMQVFATVFEIVHEFINMYKPTAFHFGADTAEPSRVKMYRSILNKLKRSGWQTTTVHNSREGTEVSIAYNNSRIF